MSQRIENKPPVNPPQAPQLQAPAEPSKPDAPPQEAAPAPVSDASVTEKRAQVQQQADAKRAEVQAGLAAGATASQEPFAADRAAQRAYQQTYGEKLQQFQDFHKEQIRPLAEKLADGAGKSDKVERFYADAVKQLEGKPEFEGVPKSMMEVADEASQAYRNTLGKPGFNLSKDGFQTSDIARSNPFKAADFMQQLANDPNRPLTRLNPDKLQQLVNERAPAGDYMLRVMSEDYTHTPDAVLSPSPRTWMTPMNDSAGVMGDAWEAYNAMGLTADTKTMASQRIAVTNSADYAMQPATWDNMIRAAKDEAAKPGSTFERFARKDEDFWQGVKDFTFKTAQGKDGDYKAALNEMGDTLPRDFASALNKQQSGLGDKFLARNMMDDKLGVNKWFTGDGLVRYPDADHTPGGREYGARMANNSADGRIYLDGRNTPQYPEIAFAKPGDAGSKVDAATIKAGNHQPNAEAVDAQPRVPGAPNTLRNEVRYGAATGGVTGLAMSIPQVAQDVESGDYGQAAIDAAQGAGTGAAIGGVSSAIENATTRGISQMAGGAARTALGQGVRQALGSGVAGGVVNAGLAAVDNYKAYESGQISGAEYTGKIAGEAAVGVTAGAAGAAIGGAIGTAIPIPVVGTLAGAAIGFGVGMATDYVARKLGVDKAVGEATQKVVETGEQVAHNVGQAVQTVEHNVEHTVDDVKNTLGNAASGAVNTLKSIFG